MRACCILLCLSTLPLLAAAACDVAMPYANMQYLAQPNPYLLTDPCTVTCSTGYTGDFCLDQTPLFSKLPMGPWNQPGYYTVGSGTLRTMSINVGGINFLQFTARDSLLVGIQANNSVVEIALYSRTITPVLTAATGGSFDSLLVRNGTVYVARTTRSGSTYSYSVGSLSDSYAFTQLVSTPARAALIEVFLDKGTVTTFAYSGGNISAFYPDGSRSVWAVVQSVTGLACGADCPAVVYASAGTLLLKVTKVGATVLRETGSGISCLAGLSALNVLLYRSSTSIVQHSLTTQVNSSIPLGIQDSSGLSCSLDASELYNQILVVQGASIRTLESVQLLCGYGLTSQALLANSVTQCSACPPPPDNAQWVEGSAACEWKCGSGFDKVGSRCVGQVVQPCPSYYTPDAAGVCTPSVLPWAGQGKYVASTQYSAELFMNFNGLSNGPPYVVAAMLPGTLVGVSYGNVVVSINGGVTWTQAAFSGADSGLCARGGANNYYYFNSRGDGSLYVAFSVASIPVQHCLWLVNSPVNSQLQVAQIWGLRARLCDAIGDGSTVYVHLCGTNFLSYATAGSAAMLPLAGGVQAGYLDASLRASLFRSPSSMVLFDGRLYVTDTGNCVIRELDLVRDTVGTIAGTAGVCQRLDDGVSKAALASPTSLIHTQYAGFFLFTDKSAGETYAVIRQLHIPTGTVRSISAVPYPNTYSGFMAAQQGVFVFLSKGFKILQATAANCPAGTSSLEGSVCVECGVGSYSDVATGSCRSCSDVVCGAVGQMVVPCQPDADARCGACTNKPAGNTVYTAASTAPGTPTGGGDCLWVYTPPCPKGYYADKGQCVGCPLWSTTAQSNSTLLSQCLCLGGGRRVGGECSIDASFDSSSALMYFPLLAFCADYNRDSPDGVCPCQPGEFMQKLRPEKVCTPCSAGYYSPKGTICLLCPRYTQPTQDRTTCQCAGGLVDASNTAMPDCVCGLGKGLASLACTDCPANTYSATTVRSGFKPCQMCPSGTYSGIGASGCVDCPFGTYRLDTSLLGCQSCSEGFYTPDARFNFCIPCSAECVGGLKETPCPTDSSKLVCSPCPAARANAHLDGGRDCATSCDEGYFERDGECVACAVYDQASCGAGAYHVPCSAYNDAACVPCANTSMPLNYAVWGYSSPQEGGPSTRCDWECEPGYEPTHPPLPEGVEATWECALAGAWRVWDLFTI